jgi:hypothetical protein
MRPLEMRHYKSVAEETVENSLLSMYWDVLRSGEPGGLLKRDDESYRRNCWALLVSLRSGEHDGLFDMRN